MSPDPSPPPPPNNPRVALLAQIYGLDLEKADTLPEVFHPLTVQQRQAVLMLGEHTLAEVCDALGLHRVTIYRWRMMPDFRRALLSLQRLGSDFVYTDAESVRRRNREVLEHLRDNSESEKIKVLAVKLLEDIMNNIFDAQLDERVTSLERTTHNLASRLGALRGMTNEELVEYTRRLVTPESDEMDD